jgi:hypothetical protein
MRDNEEHNRDTVSIANYREYASAIHQSAERARFLETRKTLKDVARCYEVLAKHVERRRHRPSS